MRFEDILDDVGSFGLYQKLLCFTVIPLTTGAVGLVYYSQLFLLAAPKHLCRISNLSPNETFQDTEKYLSKIINSSASHLTTEYYSCRSINILNGSSSQHSDGSVVYNQCENGWVYNTDTMFPTLTSYNNWVCEEAWKPYFMITCFWIGNTIGAWIFGALGDIWGRKPVIALCSIIYGTTGVACIFVHNYYGQLVLRTLMGTAHHSFSHIPLVYVVEFCGVKSRVVPVLIVMLTYTGASILAPVLAWSIWQWQILAVLSSVPALFVLVFFKCLPESPSFLMTKKKLLPAAKVLHRISKVNGLPKSKQYLMETISALDDELESNNIKQTQTFLAFWHFKKLRKNILLVLGIWMLACMCFYGHCQNTANLGNDIFTSYFLGALAEIPALATPYLMHKLGRRRPLVTTFIISGISGVIYAFLPEEVQNVSFAFALIGRMFITSAYYTTLQYGPEIFPTGIRGRGVALSETLGGIAIFTSPLIVYMGEFWTTLPLLIFATLSVIGGGFGLFLPETGGVALPQTLEEGEAFAIEAEPHFSCGSKRNSPEPVKV